MSGSSPASLFCPVCFFFLTAVIVFLFFWQPLQPMAAPEPRYEYEVPPHRAAQASCVCGVCVVYRLHLISLAVRLD